MHSEIIDDGAYLPATHAVHVEALSFAPVSVIEPAPQAEQDATSELEEYSPATQTMHALAPAALPLSVREPAKQLSQYDEATKAWYLLDGQSAQPVCAGRPWYWPSVQPKHAVAVELVEYLPFSHIVQVEAPSFAPVSVIEPAPQAEHASTADAVEYSPATQAMHALAPAALPVSVREPAWHCRQYVWLDFD